MVLPFALLLNLTNKNYPFYKLIFFALYTLICFSPLVINIFSRYGGGLFLSYYRLWLEVILYAVTIIFVAGINKPVSNIEIETHPLHPLSRGEIAKNPLSRR
jgi:predicted KAP-like P-loop ATPase